MRRRTVSWPREAAQKAIVLLKNEGGLLPLPKDLASVRGHRAER